MIRGPDARTDRFLTDLKQIQDRLDRSQREISSGRRINQVSDAPDEISHLLSLRSDLSQVEQIRANLGRVKAEVDTAENTIATAIQIAERVEVLGAQAASDLTPADARITIANEVEQLLGRLTSLANVQLEGRYLLAGDTDQTAPYSFDPSLADPVSAYQGSASTRLVQHPGGPRFSIARTAQEIFDSVTPGNNVFDSVNALRLSLRGDDGDAIRDALAGVRTAVTHMNNQLGFYGGFQNQVNEAVDFAAKQEVRLKAQISSREDADITTAILELSEARFHLETALNTEARRPRQSLFDYLR